jgi:hypothetical protein
MARLQTIEQIAICSISAWSDGKQQEFSSTYCSGFRKFKRKMEVFIEKDIKSTSKSTSLDAIHMFIENGEEKLLSRLNEFCRNLIAKNVEEINNLFSFLNGKFLSESDDLLELSRSLTRIEEKAPHVVEAVDFVILEKKIKDLLGNFSISLNDRLEKPSPSDLVDFRNLVEKNSIVY